MAVCGTPSGGEAGQITRGHHFDDGLARVNDRRPINYLYAGRTYDGPKWTPELQTKYPDGVPFTAEGFPDFSTYMRRDVHLERMTGVYQKDARAANRIAGFPEIPAGHVWHHVEDGRTLQLVPKDIQRAVKHTGGVAVIK